MLLTTGLAMALLAVLVHVIEIRQQPNDQCVWARLLEVFGRNALFVFVASGLVPRVLALLRWPDAAAAPGAWTSPLPWLYGHVFAPVGALAGDARLGSLLFACANLGVYAALAWWLAGAASTSASDVLGRRP